MTAVTQSKSDGARAALEGAPRASYRSGFFFGSLSFLVTAGVGFVSTIITSRLYGVHVIGEFALVWAPVAALWLLSTVKEQQALVREITGLRPRHPRVTQLFAVVFTFSSGLTFVVALLDAAVCWVVFPGPLNEPQLLLPALVSIAGYVLVTNMGWNFDSVLSAFVAGRQLFWVRLHEAIAFVVIAAVIGWTWKSVWGLVIATIGASLTALIHRTVVVRSFIRFRVGWREYRQGFEVLPELLRFGLKATPGQIAQGVSQQGGIWALGVIAPVSIVGAYSRALVIPRSLQQASMRITIVLYPTLVGRHKNDDHHGFDRALIDSIRYQVVGMLLLAAIIGGAAHSVLAMFGEGFDQASSALVLLALFPALAAVAVTQTQALWAVDLPGRTSVIAVLSLVATVICLIVLTPAIGMLGPAIALLAGYLIIVLFSGISLRSSLTQPLRRTWSIWERCVLVLAYGAGFGAAHFSQHLVPATGGVLLSLLAGAVAYCLAFVLLGGLNARDRRRAAELIGAVRMRRATSVVPMAE